MTTTTSVSVPFHSGHTPGQVSSSAPLYPPPGEFQSPSIRGTLPDNGPRFDQWADNSKFQSPSIRGTLPDGLNRSKSMSGKRSVSVPFHSGHTPGRLLLICIRERCLAVSVPFHSGHTPGRSLRRQPVIRGLTAFQSPSIRGTLPDKDKRRRFGGSIAKFQSPSIRGTLPDVSSACYSAAHSHWRFSPLPFGAHSRTEFSSDQLVGGFIVSVPFHSGHTPGHAKD